MDRGDVDVVRCYDRVYRTHQAVFRGDVLRCFHCAHPGRCEYKSDWDVLTTSGMSYVPIEPIALHESRSAVTLNVVHLMVYSCGEVLSVTGEETTYTLSTIEDALQVDIRASAGRACRLQ